MGDKATFLVRTSDELLAALNELAWRSRKSRNEFVVELVEEAIRKAGLSEANLASTAPKRKPGRSRNQETKKKPNAVTDQALAEFNAGIRHPFTSIQEILEEPDEE